MESEAPASIRVFFKDKQNALKGPFTKHQVQEWYQEGWFKDSSFPFYFMNNGSSPGDATYSFTLDELCSRNCDAPFSLPPNSAHFDLLALAEEVQALRVERVPCERSKKKKKRSQAAAAPAAEGLPPWERMQQPRIRKCTAAAAAAATGDDQEQLHEEIRSVARVEGEGVVPPQSLPSASAETVPELASAPSEGAEKKKKKKWNNKKNKKMKKSEVVSDDVEGAAAAAAAAAGPDQATLHKWAEEAADFFIETCKFFKGDKEMPLVVEEDFFTMTESRVQKLHEHGPILLEELFRRIREQQFLFCTFCDRFMYNVGQTFQHICNKEHRDKIRASSSELHRDNDLLIKMVDADQAKAMSRNELTAVRRQKKRWSSMRLDDPELRPTKRYIIESNMVFHANSVPGKTDYTKAQYAQHMARTLLGNPELTTSMMSDLAKHVGYAKTWCHRCKLIFADGPEYMDHLMTFDHIRKMDLFDHITMLANLLNSRSLETIE